MHEVHLKYLVVLFLLSVIAGLLPFLCDTVLGDVLQPAMAFRLELVSRSVSVWPSSITDSFPHIKHC